MPTSSARAEWRGALKRGEGTMEAATGAFSMDYGAAARFEGEPGTTPEELIAAAHAGCFSMALANILDGAGHQPETVRTTAKVSIDSQDGGFAITRSELATEVEVAGVEEEEFQRLADEAKQGCPVSQALASIDITLEAKRA